MPPILDSRALIKAQDQSNLLASVEALPNQILDALAQTQDLTLPQSYQLVRNLVVSGMGGSILGSYVIKGVYKDSLSLPLEIVPHYELPAYVGPETLVLFSSYSGTTEETLAAAADAKARGAKIMVLSSGGDLINLAKENNWPFYKLQANYNPCGQPRMAIGYAIAGQLALYAKAHLLPDETKALTKVASNLQKMLPNLAPETTPNPAKHLAYSAFDKHTVFVAAEHLIGAAHVVNNQFNENAKCLTSEWPLPEFNHHYLEALSYPEHAKSTTVFFLLNSPLYHTRVQKRVLLTKELLEQKGYETQLIQATAPTKLEQVFEIIQLGEFVAAYLPLLYGLNNPGPVHNVEWFKAKMQQDS